MKRHHITTLSAIAIVLVGVLVVVWTMNTPKEDEHPPVIAETLKKRQAARFRKSQHARQPTPLRKASNAMEFARMKKRLMQEFPNLHSPPPTPNEENSIYLLNELANELMVTREGQREELVELIQKNRHLDNEALQALIRKHQEEQPKTLQQRLADVMGKEVEWDPKKARALLDDYAPAIERIEAIAQMPPGTNEFIGDVKVSHPGALLVFLDLMRLKLRTERDERGLGLGEHELASWLGLNRIITESQGTTVMQNIILSHNFAAGENSSLNQELRRSLSVHTHPTGTRILMLPDWGAELNKSYASGDPRANLLARETRKLWNKQMTPTSLERNKNWGEPAVALAYSTEMNAIIDRLHEQSLKDFLHQKIPEIPSDNLSEEQHQLVIQHVVEAHQTLRNIVDYAAQQNLHATARLLRNLERSGLPIQSFNAIQMKELPLHPVTRQPYIYNPSDRTLLSPSPFDGGVLGVRLHPPDEGNMINFGTPIFKYDPNAVFE